MKKKALPHPSPPGRWIIPLASAGMLLAAAPSLPRAALGAACDDRPPHSQIARDNLRRAGSEGDLATAQDYADRARRQMEQLGVGAARCGCVAAQEQFQAAALALAKARDAESRRELRDVVVRATPLFEQSMAALRDCATR